MRKMRVFTHFFFGNAIHFNGLKLVQIRTDGVMRDNAGVLTKCIAVSSHHLDNILHPFCFFMLTSRGECAANKNESSIDIPCDGWVSQSSPCPRLNKLSLAE